MLTEVRAEPLNVPAYINRTVTPTLRGAWVTATAYIVFDQVTSGGSSYICRANHTSSAATQPGVGASWTTVWQIVATGGVNGADGLMSAASDAETIAGVITNKAVTPHADKAALDAALAPIYDILNTSNTSAGHLPYGLDFTGGGAWSLNRIVAGYAGPVIRLVRDSDSAASDFGVNSSTGILDKAAITAWIGASAAKVSVLYDQSGLGHDITQTTSANRPFYSISKEDDTTPVIEVGNVTGNYQRYFNMPASINGVAVAGCIYTTYKYASRYGSANWFSLPIVQVGLVAGGTGPTDGVFTIEANGTSGFQTVAHSGLGPKSWVALPSDNVTETVGIIGTASNVHVFVGGRKDADIAGAVAVWAGSQPTGGLLGKQTALQGEGEIRSLVITRPHTVSVGRSIVTALKNRHSLYTGHTRGLWCIGDSTTSGYALFAASFQNARDYAWPQVLQRTSTRWFIRNQSLSGQRIDQMDTLATAVATAGWVNSVPGGVSDCIAFLGWNDFQGGATLATVQSRMTTFIANRRSQGFAKVYAMNLYASTYVPVDADRLAFNAWLVSSAGLDGVIDLASASWTGKMYDAVHPNAAGVAQIASIAKTFLDAQP